VTSIEAPSTPGLDDRELHGLRYACLEGCGFCCTFTAEVAEPELARLRGRFPKLPVARRDGMMLLGLQGGCGACTLLKERKCTAYDLRPSHCRYFPFHVYFGRRTEAYVNRSCRGVEVQPGGDLRSEFAANVTSTLPAYRFKVEQDRAAKAHRDFESQARSADAWADVDAEIARLVARGADWFDPVSWPPTPTGEADEAGSPSEAWAVALAPFGAEDAADRPFHLAADLTWYAFRGDASGLSVDKMAEGGQLLPVRDLGSFDDWPTLPEGVRFDLAHVLHRLVKRDVLAGSIHHLVADTDFAITVVDAAEIRFADMAASLTLRAEILHRLGVPWEQVAAEAERFYDSSFLDHPTIGAWL
jgi:Fe-S-cluster containining protein